MPEKFELAPEQRKETASRVLSDAELIKGGTKISKEGVLEPTEKQIEKARVEMEKERFEAMLTSEQKKQMKEREKSDQELIRGDIYEKISGTKYTKEGRLDVPPEAIEKIIENAVLKEGETKLLKNYIEVLYNKSGKDLDKLTDELCYLTNIFASSVDYEYLIPLYAAGAPPISAARKEYFFPAKVVLESIPGNLKDQLKKKFEKKAQETEREYEELAKKRKKHPFDNSNVDIAAESYLLAGNEEKWKELFRKRAEYLESRGYFKDESGGVTVFYHHDGALKYYKAIGDNKKVEELLEKRNQPKEEFKRVSIDEKLIKFTHFDAPPELIERAESIIKKYNITRDKAREAEISGSGIGAIIWPGDTHILLDGRSFYNKGPTQLGTSAPVLIVYPKESREDKKRDIYDLK